MIQTPYPLRPAAPFGWIRAGSTRAVVTFYRAWRRTPAGDLVPVYAPVPFVVRPLA